jgi:hypothetical protein
MFAETIDGKNPIFVKLSKEILRESLLVGRIYEDREGIVRISPHIWL